MEKPPEKDPEVYSIKQSSEKPALVLEGIFRSPHQNLLNRSELIRNVVVSHAQLAALGVLGLEPLDQTALMHVLQAAFAMANLFQQNFFFKIGNLF